MCSSDLVKKNIRVTFKENMVHNPMVYQFERSYGIFHEHMDINASGTFSTQLFKAYTPSFFFLHIMALAKNKGP